jgi:hypothetical protein
MIKTTSENVGIVPVPETSQDREPKSLPLRKRKHQCSSVASVVKKILFLTPSSLVPLRLGESPLSQNQFLSPGFA